MRYMVTTLATSFPYYCFLYIVFQHKEIRQRVKEAYTTMQMRITEIWRKTRVWAWSTGLQVGEQYEIKRKSQKRVSGEPSRPLRDYCDSPGQEPRALAWGSGTENREKSKRHGEKRDQTGHGLWRRREESKTVLRFELRSFGRKMASLVEMGARLEKEELCLGYPGFKSDSDTLI